MLHNKAMRQGLRYSLHITKSVPPKRLHLLKYHGWTLGVYSNVLELQQRANKLLEGNDFYVNLEEQQKYEANRLNHLMEIVEGLR